MLSPCLSSSWDTIVAARVLAAVLVAPKWPRVNSTGCTAREVSDCPVCN